MSDPLSQRLLFLFGLLLAAGLAGAVVPHRLRVWCRCRCRGRAPTPSRASPGSSLALG